jgi:cytoskeletal protein CcmA (bactofilin family)
MWKKNEEEPPRPVTGATAQPTTYAPAAPRAAEPRRSGGQAVIGESIRIEGDVRGDEDLLIEGEVEGKISLENHSVTVGRSGRIKADIHGRNISIDGKVQGKLFADEQVIVRESGEVRGNITAPRVSLEDGSKFKGAIDMEPKPPRSGGADKPAERAASAAKPAGEGNAAGEIGSGGGIGSGGAPGASTGSASTGSANAGSANAGSANAGGSATGKGAATGAGAPARANAAV